MPVEEPVKESSAGSERVQPLDPQALVGEWSGNISMIDDPSGTAKLVLTIERGSDGYVFGQMEISPHAGPIRTRRFRGMLEGNELRIGPWRLTVFPRRMTGHFYGGLGRGTRHGGIDIDLLKK
jgi:hypothetical protein